MSDQAQFSDDISALWGPDGPGGLEPARQRTVEPASDPPNGAAPNGTSNGSTSAADHRLAGLEREIRILAARMASDRSGVVDHGHLAALQTDFQIELAEARREILSQLDARLADSEARAQDQVRDAAGQVGERLSGMENDLRQSIAQVAAAMEAHEYEPVGRHRARTLRQELREELDARLSEVEAAAEEAVDRRIAAAEAQLSRRLDDQATAAARHDDRLAQLEQRLAHLGEQLDAYQARVQAQQAETAARRRIWPRH